MKQDRRGVADNAFPEFLWTKPRLDFVIHYVATGDEAHSAQAAKLPKGDTPATLLDEPAVARKITEMQEGVLRRAHENDDSIIGRLSNWADSNIWDYLITKPGIDPGEMNTANVKPLDIKKMPKHMQQRIKAFSTTTTVNAQGDRTTNYKLEMHDAMRANLELARILRVGEEDQYDPEDRAQQLFDFLQETESVRAVEGGEFPEDKAPEA